MSLSGPPKGGFGKSMSSSFSTSVVSASVATNEGVGNKEAVSNDYSSSKCNSYTIFISNKYFQVLAFVRFTK